jgi:hypothetical protein
MTPDLQPPAGPPLSIAKAISVGTLVVNGPVFLFLAAPMAFLTLEPRATWPYLVFPAFFAAAWLWWSVSVPRWRLWAYARVASTQELKRRAVAANLTWPSGSFFERTEIKSASHRMQEELFERRKP